MRLVFFGSGQFACPILDALIAADHEIHAVYTRPDKHAGRKLGITATPVKLCADRYRLSVHQPDNPNDQDTVKKIQSINPDVGIVVAYGHLLSSQLFQQPRYGILNVHASLLPSFRGAAPVPHAIMAGEETTGATVFRINDRFDEGDVLGKVEIPIGPHSTARDILRDLAPLGARLLESVLGQLEAGWIQPTPQNENGRPESRAPKFLKTDGRIDWRMQPCRIDRMVRAMQPWPLAYTLLPTFRRPRTFKPASFDNVPPELQETARRTEAERRARAEREARHPEIIWVRTNILEVEPLPDIDDDPPPPPAPWEYHTPCRGPRVAKPSGGEAAARGHHKPSNRLREAAAAAECRWPTPPVLVGEAPPGLILRVDPARGIVVRCGGGAVRLTRIQPENRSAMDCVDFLRGTQVKPLTQIY